MAIAYDVAALGIYLFLRRQSMSPTAATFAAATFAFAGYMSGQIVHLDLIEGAAWLPWMLMATDSLLPMAPGPLAGTGAGPSPVPSRRRRSSIRWAALLAAVVGLTILTGGAEAIIDGLAGVFVYVVWHLVSQGRRGVGRRRLAASVAWIGTGLVAGAALGTAQWLPGLTFTAQSQRAGSSYQFFTTGSLNPHLLVLLVSPFVLGTNQNHPAVYVGQYNLPEVTSYAGILALIAATALLARRHRRRPEARCWWVWYPIMGLGLLSALGGETPFGRVLYVVPIVMDERLLNRNLLLVDFGLACLLGWWVHVLLDRPADAPAARPSAAASPARERRAPGRRAEIALVCAPAVVIVVLCVAFWADGRFVLQLLDAEVGLPSADRLELAGLVTVGAVIAVVATGLALAEARYGARALRRRLSVVLMADLLVFTVFMLHGPITEAAAQAQTPAAAALARATGNGRFIIYDPDQYLRGELYALGQTDLNVFSSLSSGQGYTALVDGGYYRATGAHYQEDLDPASLRGPVWDVLNTRTLLSLPSYFVTPVGAGPPPGSTVQFPSHPSAELRDYTGAPLPTDTPVVIGPGRSHTWYLGGVLSVSRWSVGLDRGRAGDLQAGQVTPTGGVRWLASPPTGPARSLTITGHAVPVGGLVVRNRSRQPVVVGVPTAETAEAGTVALDGRMQYGVSPAHWRFTGTIGSFGVFENTRARGWAWATQPAGGPPAAATSVVTGPPDPDGDQRVTVRAPAPVDLVRSMSWTPGWQATVQSARRRGRSGRRPRRAGHRGRGHPAGGPARRQLGSSLSPTGPPRR